MSNPMTSIGIVHTVLSVIPVVAGLWCLVRDRRIDPATAAGKLYVAGLVLSVVSSFPLHWFNPAHALGIVSLIAAFGGMLAPGLSFLGKARPYLAAFGLSFSFFLLNIPAVNETLSRLPPSNPIGNGPESAPVQHTLLAWAVIFVIGAIAQQWMVYREQRR